MHRPSLVAPLVAAALVLAGCRGEEPPTFGTGVVEPARVVQTVAAVASLEPAARTTVTAPSGGEIEELLVADGDLVEAGDPVARLDSDSIDLQVTQAEAAVDAADAFAQAAAGAGVDVSPIVGAFRGQLDAVFPPLIEALSDQLGLLESTLEEVRSVEVPTLEVPTLEAPAIEVPAPPSPPSLPDGLELPEELPLPDGLELPEDLELPEELELPRPPTGDDTPDDAPDPGPAPESEPLVDTSELESAIADARARLERTEADYEAAARDLAAAEEDLGAGTDAAAEGQTAAAEAQRDQAELALEAARSRIDDLTVLAPADGVIELARAADVGGGGAGGADLDGLPEGLADGDLPEGLPDGLGDLGGLLGGGATGTSGPIAEGVSVGPGQPLLTVFDLSSFTARVSVDEIDVVEVEEGQDVTVLVDAFPDAELAGTVSHVAISPETSPAGGAIFPVTVELTSVPDDVALRVGLTASAEIAVREVDAELTVPTGALLRQGGDEVVHALRDGVVRAVPVTVAAVGDDAAAVEGDLEPGEVVITSGVETVEDGTEIDDDQLEPEPPGPDG